MPKPTQKPWRPSSAWDIVALNAGRFGSAIGPAGVSLQPLDHVDVAGVTVRDATQDRLRNVVYERFAIMLPEAGCAVFSDNAAGRICIWTAPGQWLFVASTTSQLKYLRDNLDGIAAVTDQGDAYALVRISGPAARNALAKLIAIDLQAKVFGAGSTARTSMAHVSVQLWAESDPPTFVLAAPRTMAMSVWRSLTAAAAEYGYEVTR